jgi:hypothetical protein
MLLAATSQNRRKSRGRQSFCKTYDGDDYFVLAGGFPVRLQPAESPKNTMMVGCRLLP